MDFKMHDKFGFCNSLQWDCSIYYKAIEIILSQIDEIIPDKGFI